MSVARFEKCFQHLLLEEGGYVNHAKDPGRETNMGISARSYPQLDIKNLTVEKAREIYFRDYWMPTQCDIVPAGIDAMLFDAAVNQGVSTALRMLQVSAGVKVDGIIGPITLTALRSAAALQNFAAERCLRYAITHNFSTFGAGWMRRVFRVYEFAKSSQEPLQ